MEGKILIIDDEVDICTLLKLTLEKRGFTVLCVHTLRDALVNASAFEPAIVILDINLPDGNGLEMLGRLKRVSKGIIVISAFDSVREKTEAFIKGATFFLAKPFRLPDAENMVLQLAQ